MSARRLRAGWAVEAVLLAAGLHLAVPPPPLQGQATPSGLALLEATAARYRSAHTVCADFTQRLTVPLLGSERTGSGRLCQAQPDRFAMRFTDPDGDAIVVDGSAIWVYYPSLDPRQVLKLPMAERPGGVDIHREFLHETDSKYEVTYEAADQVAGHATHRLRLVPKQVASYRSAVVWIDRGSPLLRQLRVEEENGNVRTVTLERVAFDPPGIGADWFTFTPPPGAQVISR